jgi:PAS domain S-box-containing protein
MEENLGLSITSANEERRVQALKRYNILNTPPEKSFDNIATLATQFFDLPIAIISFVDTQNVYLKANLGVAEIRNTPRNNSVCSLAITSDEVTVFEDIPSINPALLTDPLLVGEMGYKFYAGAPLVTQDGFRIGTVCVIGKDKRTFSAKEAQMLKSLATIVMDEIELRVRGVYETEKKVLEAAEQLQLNTANQSIISNMPVAVCVLKGKDFVVELANIKMLEVWDTTANVIGMVLTDIHPELKGQSLYTLMLDVFATGNPFFGNELPVSFLRDGATKERYFNFVIQPIKDLYGDTTGLMIIALDVTAQIEAKKELEVNEKQLDDIVKHSATGLAVFSGRNLIVENANQYVFDLWQLAEEEVIGKSLLDIFPQFANTNYRMALMDIFDRKKNVSFDELLVSYPHPTGYTAYYLDLKYVPLLDDQQEVTGVIATIKDITESVLTRKKLEKIELEQQQSNEVLLKTIQDLAGVNKEMLSTYSELALTHQHLNDTLEGLSNQPEMRETILGVRENLQKAEDTLRVAIETANMGTFQVDIKSGFCSPSAGLKRIFGFLADEEMTLEHIMNQITPDYKEVTMDAIRATMKSGEPYHMDYSITGFRDQQIHWLRSFGKIEYATDGSASHFSGVVFEIPATT